MFESILSIHLSMKKFIFILTLLLFCFTGFSQSRYISQTTKRIVYARDGGKCQCCGSYSNLEYDHIIPYSCGGNSDVSNIQLLCLKCNRSKSNGCYCKVHNKKVGNNCCAGKSNANTSNKKPSAVAQQCRGTTQKGLRCKNKTRNANGRCYLHQ